MHGDAEVKMSLHETAHDLIRSDNRMLYATGTEGGCRGAVLSRLHGMSYWVGVLTALPSYFGGES